LTAHEGYLRLGRNEAERQSTYRELFQATISGNDLSEIRACTHKGWALGGERFKERIETLGQRRAASKGVGRPKKEGHRV
jgi:putative transposase